MLKISYLCLTLLLLFSNYCISKPEKPIFEITWLQSNTPPFHLQPDELQPGLCDNLTKQLISAIEDVKHTHLVMPQKRINKYIQEGRNVCFPCVIHKKSANKVYIYSNPTAIYPAFSIIATKSKADIISKKHGNPIDLISLFTDESFTYGQAGARLFSADLNTIIENSLTHQNVSLSWNSDNESGAVINRLRHGFLDYSLDYPFMASYFNKQINLKEIISIPIAKSKNSLIQGAVGCATNAPNNFASQAITKINAVLKSSILSSSTYQQSQRYWLDEHIENFDMLYYQYVLNFDSQTSDAPISTADHNKEQL